MASTDEGVNAAPMGSSQTEVPSITTGDLVFTLPKMVVMDNLQFQEIGGVVTLKDTLSGFDRPPQLTEGLVLLRVNEMDIPTLASLQAFFESGEEDGDAGEVILSFGTALAIAVEDLPLSPPAERTSVTKTSKLPPPPKNGHIKVPSTEREPPPAAVDADKDDVPRKGTGHGKAPSQTSLRLLEMKDLLDIEGDAEDPALHRFLISANDDVSAAVQEYIANNGNLKVPDITDPEMDSNSDIEYEVSIAEGKIGMIVENLAERTVVVEVKSEGEAKKAGVKEDSVLVSVNGVSVEHLTHRETLSMITDSRRPMKLRVRQLLDREIEKLRGEANSHANNKASTQQNHMTEADHHPFPRKVQPYFQTVFEGLSAEKRIGLCHKMALITDDESALMTASLSSPVAAPPQKEAAPAPVVLTVSEWPLGLSVSGDGGQATVTGVAEGSRGYELGLSEHCVLLNVAGTDVNADNASEVAKVFSVQVPEGGDDDDEVACPYTIPFTLTVRVSDGVKGEGEDDTQQAEEGTYTVDRTVEVLSNEFQGFFTRPQLDENDFCMLLTDIGNLFVSEPELGEGGVTMTSISTETSTEGDDKFANILKLLEQLSAVGAELQLSDLWETVVKYVVKVLDTIAAENRTGDNTHVVHVLRRLLESKKAPSKMAGCKLWAEVYERIRKATEQNGENSDTQLCLVQLRGLFDRICQPSQSEMQTVQKNFAAQSLASVANAVGVKGLEWLMGNYTVLCKAKEEDIKRTMVFSSLLLLSEVREIIQREDPNDELHYLKLMPGRVFPFLDQLAREGSFQVRMEFAEKVGAVFKEMGLNHVEVIKDILKVLLEDPNEEVQCEAAASISDVGVALVSLYAEQEWNMAGGVDKEHPLLPYFNSTSAHFQSSMHMNEDGSVPQPCSKEYFTSLNFALNKVKDDGSSFVSASCKREALDNLQYFMPFINNFLNDGPNVRVALARSAGILLSVFQNDTLESIKDVVNELKVDQDLGVQAELAVALMTRSDSGDGLYVKSPFFRETILPMIAPILLRMSQSRDASIRLLTISCLRSCTASVVVDDASLRTLCTNMLRDDMHNVRQETVKALCDLMNAKPLSSSIGGDPSEGKAGAIAFTMETFLLNEMKSLQSNKVYHYRQVALWLAKTLMPGLSDDDKKVAVLQTIQPLTQDPVPNVRGNVAQCMGLLADCVSAEQIESYITPCLGALSEDDDEDVSYFARCSEASIAAAKQD